MVETTKEKELNGNLLLFSMFALETVYLYSASSATLIICGVLGIITFLYAHKYNSFLLRVMICLAVWIVVLVSINRLLVLNCSWRGCLRISFISLPIAYLLCDVHINRYVALSFFYVVFIYTAIMILLADPAELYRIFVASSRNYISVLLIACMFPYYLACERDHVEVSVFPALLSLTASIYVQSRGGMIASGLLVFFSFIREIYLGIAKDSFKNKKNLIRFIIAVVILFGIVLFTFDNSAENLSRFSTTKELEYPVTRLDMWKEYITVTGSSVSNIVLGPPLTTCPFIMSEAYNSHNSYFMTHSYMGIAGFFAVIIGGVGYLVLCIKKKQYNLLFLSITFLLRATTDYLFPMLFCDCIILLMIIETGIVITEEVYEYKERKMLNNSNPCV